MAFRPRRKPVHPKRGASRWLLQSSSSFGPALHLASRFALKERARSRRVARFVIGRHSVFGGLVQRDPPPAHAATRMGSWV